MFEFESEHPFSAGDIGDIASFLDKFIFLEKSLGLTCIDHVARCLGRIPTSSNVSISNFVELNHQLFSLSRTTSVQRWRLKCHHCCRR